MKIVKKENNYLILKDDGTPVILTGNEVSLLVNFIGKEGLRDQIDDRLHAAELEYLDFSKYEGSRDEFIQEVFSTLEDEIDCGNSVSDFYIDECICEFGSLYGLEQEV